MIVIIIYETQAWTNKSKDEQARGFKQPGDKGCSVGFCLVTHHTCTHHPILTIQT